MLNTWLLILIVCMLNTACSSRTKVFHQERKLTTKSQPTFILDRHENLASNILVTFELTYSPNEESRLKERQAALTEAIKTLYLFTYHAPTQDTSDYRLTNCASYRLKEDHLICSNISDARAWRLHDAKMGLSEYYWQERFHTVYQEDLTQKPGLFWEPLKNHEALLELKDVQENSDQGINIRFSFVHSLLKPRSFFPLYRLHLLDQRSPTIHLSSLNQYLALKKTDSEVAPVIGLSSELQRFIRRHVIQGTKEQGVAIVETIEKFIQSMELDQSPICPLNTSVCEFRPFVNFKDGPDVQKYLYNKEYRHHIFGLLLLAHTTLTTTRISDTQEELSFSIDMKKILMSYKTQLNRAFIESIDFPL